MFILLSFLLWVISDITFDVKKNKMVSELLLRPRALISPAMLFF